MRLLKKALLIAAVLVASPVWAHDARGHAARYGGPHHGRIDNRPHFDWRHHPHYAYGWRAPYRPYYGAGYYYYPPYPAYGYAVAPPGIQVVVPNIYIPLR
jgi:hypothetical protein